MSPVAFLPPLTACFLCLAAQGNRLMNAPISVERGWFRFGTWGQARQARTRSTVLRSASFRKNAFVRTFVGHFLRMAEVCEKIGHLAERVGFEGTVTRTTV